jgi:hypothetical protein
MIVEDDCAELNSASPLHWYIAGRTEEDSEIYR